MSFDIGPHSLQSQRLINQNSFVGAVFSVSVNNWKTYKHSRRNLSVMVFFSPANYLVFVMLLYSNVVLHLPSLQVKHCLLILGSRIRVSLKSRFSSPCTIE